MKTLIFIIVLATLGFMGYQHYSKQQELLQQQQQALEKYERDKKALEQARSTKDPKAIQNFIYQYPNSAWINTARYYLEKQILDNAIKARNINALQRFTETYPNSVWKQSAIDYEKKIRIENRNKLTESKPTSEPTHERVNKTRKTINTPVMFDQQPSPSQTNATKQAKDDAMDRVNRALSIYQKINKEKSKQVQKQQQQRQQLAQREKRCNKLRDQLKQFRSNVRWYELNEDGERVYLDKKTVKANQQSIQNDIKQYCQ